MTVEQIIAQLYTLENKEKVLFKEKKFGIRTHQSLGIYHKDLKEIASTIIRDKSIDRSSLAIGLFNTEIYEARILCSKIFPIKELTNNLLEEWVKVFDTWEICDSFCMGLFAKSTFAVEKIVEWSSRENEFEKRAAFAILAAYCMADKKADNSVYEAFFSIVKRAATDERLYVKKAVNWALRSIGKRNIDLNKAAIKAAEEIEQIDSKSAKWIAKDALRELKKENVNILDYPREIYRNQG